MTIQELIQHLQTLDQTMPVVYSTGVDEHNKQYFCSYTLSRFRTISVRAIQENAYKESNSDDIVLWL